jgi:hypothetical protein
LAQSLLGYTPARGDEPVFVDAINKIVAAAKKHGKWVGRLVNDGEGAVRELKTFDSVAITSVSQVYHVLLCHGVRVWFLALRRLLAHVPGVPSVFE